MSQRNKHEELHKRNVRTLQNDYVRSNPQATSQRKAKQKVMKRRRLLLFFIFATVVTAGLVKTLIVQNERLTEKEFQKAEIEQQLESVQETQEMLNLQITKLEDDEYIAKLARKEYFLSEEGEIIFTIPSEDNAKKDKQEDEKE